jgi:hypothetical protein
MWLRTVTLFAVAGNEAGDGKHTKMKTLDQIVDEQMTECKNIGIFADLNESQVKYIRLCLNQVGQSVLFHPTIAADYDKCVAILGRKF